MSVARNGPCPCGSGQKYKRCCGAPGVSAPAAAAPRASAGPDATLQQALQALQSGRPATAQSLLAPLRTAFPQHPVVAYLDGYAALECGDFSRALTGITAAIRLGLNDPAAFFHLGRAQVARRDFPAAEAAFAKALTLRPDFPDATRAWANCCYELGRHQDAAAAYQSLLPKHPGDPLLQFNAAHAGLLAGTLSPPAAAALLEEALAGRPDDARIHAALATVCELQNRLDDAGRHAARASELDPGAPSTLRAAAKVALRRHDLATVLALSDDIPATASAADRAGLLSVRGQALDAAGRYAEALAALTAAKAAQFAGQPRFDPAALAQALNEHRTAFSPPARAASATPAEPRSVFIVGFYRCGSTLLEQMLGMHPEIAVVGESPALAAVEETLLAVTGEARAAVMAHGARDYLAATDGVGTARVIVDKELNNLLRLPLIERLFPHARVLHVLRHPLDSAISTLSRNFLEQPRWTASLADIAAYYAAAWAHLDATRPPETMYRAVRYEDLVESPEATLRDVIDFIGLDWRPEMLDFHTSARVAKTASYAQVAQPLYKTSLKRYEAYLPHLDDAVRTALAPVVRAMNYAL